MYLEDLRLEVEELLQDGRESSGRIFFLVPETWVILGAVCRSLGAAVPIEV